MAKHITDVRPTVCFWCKAECGLLAHVKNNRLMKLEEDPEIMEHLGYYYYRQKQPARAIYWWSRSLEYSFKQETSSMIEQARRATQLRKP